MNETSSIPSPLPYGGAELSAVAAVPPPRENDAQMGSVLAVSDTMVVLTWLAFLIACAALYKLAWKPISQALDRREDKIRQSLKDADDVRANAKLDAKRQQAMLEKATLEAGSIVERARLAAEAVGRAIEAQARADADDLVRDARAEIEKAKAKALADIRREASGLALDVAERILGQKLDAAADREWTDRLIRDIP